MFMYESPKKGSASDSATKPVKKVHSKVSFEEIGVAVASEAICMLLQVATASIDLTSEVYAIQMKEIFSEDPMLTFRTMIEHVRTFWESHPLHRNIWWD